MEGGAVGHNFEMGPTQGPSLQVWFFLVEETGENHRLVASRCQTLSHGHIILIPKGNAKRGVSPRLTI
jgi:hypothetical protein